MTAIKISPITLKAFFYSLLLCFLAFLPHTLFFLWGNHDVKFIKEELLLSSGLFEGRFTQFIPYRLLVNGQILPVINNLLGLAFLCLGLIYLAKYLNIKQNTLIYTLFTTFFITEPYTLSWFYFTFITISCMLWVLLGILGLYISGLIYKKNNKILLSALAILCFYLPLGGYPPVINMFAVCFMAKLTFDTLNQHATLKELFNQHKYTPINLGIALILFKLSLKLVNPDNVYNLETTPPSELPLKLLNVIKIAFNQFLMTSPFMEKGYKLTLLIMCLLAVLCIILNKTSTKNKATTLFFLTSTVIATGLTTLLVVPHTEYVSRIDFYGFGFLYAIFLGILLNKNTKFFKNLGILFAILLITLNIIKDYTALTVWYNGFSAEFKILSRVLERIEEHPAFNPKQKYHFHQVGDISLRPKYYRGTYTYEDVFLLPLPYLAMWQGANLAQFYAPKNYISKEPTLQISDITPEVHDFFINKARPWPDENSIYINDSIIVVVYNHQELRHFKEQLYMLKQ